MDVLQKTIEKTLFNQEISKTKKNLLRNILCVLSDGTALDYHNALFDICFSNSVNEHIGSLENQTRFAAEIQRVGRQKWIKTPGKSFFFEPRLLISFIHFLPRKTQKKWLRNCSIWGLFVRPSDVKNEEFFPGCQIQNGRFLGMTKSYIAIRK